MNIIFIDQANEDLALALGISSARQDFISNELDSISQGYKGNKKVYVADIIKKIDSFTISDNEFIWAFILHMNWVSFHKIGIPLF